MTKTKRLSTILLGAILALGVGAGLGASRVETGKAATEYSHTITEKLWSSYDSTEILTGVAWTINGTGGSVQNYDATKGQRFGSSNNPTTKLNLTTRGIYGTISNVKITTSGAKDISSNVEIKVGATSFLTGGKTTASLTDTSTEYSFIGTGSGLIDIEGPLQQRLSI